MSYYNYPYGWTTYSSYNRPLLTYDTGRSIEPLFFNVCRSRRNQDSTTSVTVWTTDTIRELKEKVARCLAIYESSSNFFLELFDRDTYEWKRISDSNPFVTINGLNLRSNDLLSIEWVNQSRSSNQHSSPAVSSFNSTDNLTLYLCKTPLDKTDFIQLKISSASTIGKLRRKAYEYFNISAYNQPIYVSDGDYWAKYDIDMDNVTIENYPIRSYAFLSIDHAAENYTSKLPKGLCGLSNLGNTCFMNSVFQCLSNIPEFSKKIFELSNEINAPIINQYRRLLEKLWSGEHRSLNPSLLVYDIKDKLTPYNNYRQQDAQEFMNYFLNLMHAELSTSKSLITDYFYGQMQSKVKCLECQNTEIQNEPISFLPLPISNCNEKTIVYVKTNGEYRTVSLQTDASIRTVADLKACFCVQYEPSLSPNYILVVKLVNYILKTQYEPMQPLSEIHAEDLVLLQCSEKFSDQKYILCEFIDVSNRRQFRPPSILTVPSHSCRYVDLSDQLDDLLGHLCSVTNAPISACHLSWYDQSERQYKLDRNYNLPYLKSVEIEMPVDYVEIYKVHNHINNSMDRSSLKSLITDFFHEELLDSDYHCTKCSKPTKARRKSSLCLPLPEVLIIQLKRFTFDIRSSEKIDTFISFPVDELDLSEYIVKDDKNQEENNSSTKYNLVAVSNHIGNLTSGHYTTYAKNRDDKQWYLFDDTNVTKVNNDKDIITNNAYILVYVRTNQT
ncbi:hypothetical protein I4U23_007004 [Adineta vaga]|nr:hypothetical protein I4U23_007004 [Adineta vaga]